MDEFLFKEGSESRPSPGKGAAEAKAVDATGGKPRLRLPQRDQVEFRWSSLDQLLEPEHQARVVWTAICGLARLCEKHLAYQWLCGGVTVNHHLL